MAGTKNDVRTLTDYMKAKKRAACPVCQLSDTVRRQLVEAREKGIRRRDQLEWLRVEVGADITDADLTQHVNGRHDEP